MACWLHLGELETDLPNLRRPAMRLLVTDPPEGKMGKMRKMVTLYATSITSITCGDIHNSLAD